MVGGPDEQPLYLDTPATYSLALEWSSHQPVALDGGVQCPSYTAILPLEGVRAAKATPRLPPLARMCGSRRLDPGLTSYQWQRLVSRFRPARRVEFGRHAREKYGTRPPRNSARLALVVVAVSASAATANESCATPIIL